MVKFRVGQKVSIKPEAWERLCISENKNVDEQLFPGHQFIDQIFDTGVDNKIMLLFPRTWWDEDDLINEEPEWEIVKSITINNKQLSIDDKCYCCCEYKVNQLHPVWDSITGKHLQNHKNNSVRYTIITSKKCLIHSGHQ